MTGLLVSVRSAEEAKTALAGGADIVDVKEPRRGALGPADPRVWREIQAAIGERVVTSVALGELLHDAVENLAAQTHGFRFAKIGLAGCQTEGDWIARWQRTIHKLPAGVEQVPVAYADWRQARSPSPCDVLPLAEASSARLMLIDTHHKSAGGLLDHLCVESLSTIALQSAKRGVRLALAGSLQESAIETLLALAPAYFGVRGAACGGGRDGAIELARVKSLAQLVCGARRKAAS